ncbi:MAG: hypothetical protein AMJ81_05850 [Phycisphaerae bacterium SM23_33]|jgi:hypothetical protein|nr:MAG: hypothetical protein AMJ81_05850 [Phycisphaerae bacterium SM23_33]
MGFLKRLLGSRRKRLPTALEGGQTSQPQQWQKLCIGLEGLDCDQLLSDWRWLVGSRHRPVALTVFGDWFLETVDGNILFLDLVSGELKKIASNIDDFRRMCRDRENLNKWFMADFAYLCFDRGIVPGPGQCLSYRIPPILGGELCLENVEVSDLMVHESILGQIHRQVKDLPPGTPIDRIIIDGPEP